MKTHRYISIYNHSHSLLLIVKLSGEMGQTNRSTDYYWRPLVHGQLCRPCAEQLGLALADEAVDW